MRARGKRQEIAAAAASAARSPASATRSAKLFCLYYVLLVCSYSCLISLYFPWNLKSAACSDLQWVRENQHALLKFKIWHNAACGKSKWRSCLRTSTCVFNTYMLSSRCATILLIRSMVPDYDFSETSACIPSLSFFTQDKDTTLLPEGMIHKAKFGKLQMHCSEFHEWNHSWIIINHMGNSAN